LGGVGAWMTSGIGGLGLVMAVQDSGITVSGQSSWFVRMLWQPEKNVFLDERLASEPGLLPAGNLEITPTGSA